VIVGGVLIGRREFSAVCLYFQDTDERVSNGKNCNRMFWLWKVVSWLFLMGILFHLILCCNYISGFLIWRFFPGFFIVAKRSEFFFDIYKKLLDQIWLKMFLTNFAQRSILNKKNHYRTNFLDFFSYVTQFS
jgi:hypothetical protein